MRRPWLIPLLPFYALAVRIRNLMFDFRLLPTTKFEFPVVVIGNLIAGGSGKTPHTEYLLRLLSDKHCGVISRGYGRKSKGFKWVELSEKADQVGDEPLQIKKKFPQIPVAVCEDRVLAVPEILGEYPATEVILFDDAFQHRYLKGRVNILLTAYGDLFMDDFLLPAGNLREQKKGAKRADFIMITKCPEALSEEEKTAIRNRVKRYSDAPVFYSIYERREPVFVNASHAAGYPVTGWKENNIFVLSAIAHGSSWANSYLDSFKEKVGELCYPDHYRFTRRDMDLFIKKWKATGKPLVMTTEKDWMRLAEFSAMLSEIPLFYFPIEVRLPNGETEFNDQLRALLFTDA